MIGEVRPYVADIELGVPFDVAAKLEKVLHDTRIFGVDLYEVGLAERTCQYFEEMTAGTGAVLATLKKYTE